MRTRLCTQFKRISGTMCYFAPCHISMTHDRLDLTLKNRVFLEMLSTYVTTPFD